MTPAAIRFTQTEVLIVLALALAAGDVYAQKNTRQTPQSISPSVKDPSAVASYEKLLRDADILIKRGKPDHAYKMLEPFEFEHSGETRFDYLIGIAALDSGKPDRATLALERVLAVDPDFVAARLDLARAYYQLGDLLRAKTEFTVILKQSPSLAARFTIQKYLDEIAARAAGKQARFAGYVEGVVGYDSNVNNSTDEAQIYVDVLGGNRTLAPTNVKAADNYLGVAAGGEMAYKLNEKLGIYAGADLRQRGNRTQKDFDTQGAMIRAGVAFGADHNRLRAGVLGEYYNLGDTHNRDVSGFNAEWRYAISPRNQLNLFAQHEQYRFVDVAMSVNDFNQQATGIGGVHVLGNGMSSLFGSLYYGTEKDVSTKITQATPDGGRADGEKKFSGLRAGGQVSITESAQLFIRAGAQVGNYSKVNPLFLRQRSDRQHDLTAGINWHLGKLLTLRPQLNYSTNNSNIAIYLYDRIDFSVTVRRDFR
jgi:outer membrane protein